MYIHELPGWPRLHWSRKGLGEAFPAVRNQQGRLIGHMEASVSISVRKPCSKRSPPTC